MAPPWILSDNKFPRVSRTLLTILADLNKIVVWMVSTCPLISKSSSPFINPSVTVLRAPIPIGITVTFMFHLFFNSLARSRYLSFFSFSFNFSLCFARTVYNFASCLFFLFSIIRSGHLAKIRWSVCMSKSQRSLCVSFSRTDVGLCI